MATYTLPGHSVRLRPIRVDDVDHVMTWINDPEVTRNFAGMSAKITREQEIAYLERMIASDADRLNVVETVDGTYLGNAGVHQIYWPARNGRLGVVIGARGMRGKGYGTQTMRLLCSWAFAELGLHKVWLIHYSSNARMAHISGKLGFQREGVLRDEYFHDEGFHDMVRWGLLEGELLQG